VGSRIRSGGTGTAARRRSRAASFVSQFVVYLVVYVGVAIALAGGMLALRACGASGHERPHVPLPLPFR